MDGLSVAKIRTSLVQCLRGYSVNGFGLQRKKDAGGPYMTLAFLPTHATNICHTILEIAE